MKKGPFGVTGILSGLIVTLFAVLGTCAFSWAEDSPVKSQAPGHYQMMVGKYEVTALYDGFVEVYTKYLLGISPAEVNKIADRMFVPPDKMISTFNVYLVNTGSQVVLIDTGAGRMSQPGWKSLRDIAALYQSRNRWKLLDEGPPPVPGISMN